MSAQPESKSAKPWFRKYSEWMNDPKVQMMPEADQRRLDMLFCLRCSGQAAPSDEVVIFTLRISPEEWARSKALFIEKGFINEKNRLLNWEKRQYETDSSAERMRKYRQKKKAGDGGVTSHGRHSDADVTAPDTDSRIQITETDTELGDSNESLARSDADASSEPANLEAETGSDQPQDSNKMPAAAKGESPAAYQQRYMTWAREEILRLKEAKRAEWEIAYPAVDLDRECARAAVWLDSNPKKRKTRIAAFLTGWLSRTQERGGNAARAGPPLNTAEQRQAVTVNAVRKILEDIGDE